MEIKMGGKYRLATGGKVLEILSVDAELSSGKSVVAVVEEFGSVVLRTYFKDGQMFSGCASDRDLVEIDEREMWVNVYLPEVYTHANRELANKMANLDTRIGIVKITVADGKLTKAEIV